MSAPVRRAPVRNEPTPSACSVPGCAEPVVRHLALVEARRGLDGLPESGRTASLCRAHYKQWKRATRDARTLDRLAR